MIDTIIAKDAVPCGCGRSATGFCTGLHALSDEEWDARVFDESFLKEQQNITAEKKDIIEKKLSQRSWHDGTMILDAILQQKFPKESGKFLAVGANIGNDWSWPLLAEGWTGVLVEPDPFACSKLIDNCQQWKDQVSIVNSAMSSTTGLTDFYVSRKSSYNSSLNRRWQSKMLDLNPSRDKNDRDYVYKIITNTITMKDLIELVGSEFRVVVIDAEGMDSDIVLSTDWNNFSCCELICIEHEFAEIEPHQDVIQHLESFGFIFTDQDNAHAIYQKVF